MATSAQPQSETENQQPQNQDLDVQPPQEPQDSVVDTSQSDKEKAALALVREQHQKILQLEQEKRELEASKQQVAPQPEITDPTASRDLLFNNPDKFFEDKLNKALDKQLAPLKEFVSGFKAETAYEQMKRRYSVLPQYANYFGIPEFVQAVDAMMAHNEVNEANMSAAVMAAIGAYHIGAITSETPLQPSNNRQQPTRQNTPPNTSQQPSSMTHPAHLSSSPPPTPNRPSNSTPTRVYSEQEKRVMREWNMTPEEYDLLMNAPADQVINTRLPEKK